MKKLMILVISVIVPLIMAAQVPLTETNCSNGIDDDGDGLIDCMDPDCMGSPDCDSLNIVPGLKGVVEGTGTYFEITNSDYLNVTLSSSNEITIFLSSVPQMISMNINRPATAPTPYEATLTINGLLPSTVYYKYDDSYHNLDSIITDLNGNYTWSQNLSAAHHLWIQPTRSTIFICDDATGCGCTTVGTWDPITKTCTLTTNVSGAIQIDSPGITLDGGGKSITGDSTGYGVHIPAGVNNVTIKNCVISNFTEGIHLQSSSNSALTNNTASNNNFRGIYLYSSSYNNLTNNTANSNSTGIYLESSPNSTLAHNTANSNLYGITLYTDSITVINNTASNNNYCGIYLYLCSNNSLTDNTANANSYSGIYIYSGSSNNLTNNATSNNSFYGIYLSSSSNNNLNNNTANSNGHGIFLYTGSDDNTLTNNITNSNSNGIYLYNSSDNNLTGNTASNNFYSGILLSPGSNNNIDNNTVSYNNGFGIMLSSSSNNNVTNNTVSNNNNDGILLSGSTNNYLTNNTASNNNKNGMSVQSCQYNYIGGTGAQQPNTINNNGISGIYLTASNGIKISGNSIYNNPIAVKNLNGSNNNKVAPVITAFDGATVVGTSDPNDTIEIFGSTGNENANEYLGTVYADYDGNWTINTGTHYPGVIATATNNNNTSAFSSFLTTSIPGATCGNAIGIEPSSGYQEFVVGQSGVIWLKLAADSNRYFVHATSDSCLFQMELYKNDCANLIFLESNDSLSLTFESYVQNEYYFVKLSGNNNCVFRILFNSYYAPMDMVCEPDVCSFIENPDFDIVENPCYASYSPFGFQMVCGWHCSWGSPRIYNDATTNYENCAYMWSGNLLNPDGDYVLYGESIYEKIHPLLEGRVYHLKIKYNIYNYYFGSNWYISIKDYIDNISLSCEYTAQGSPFQSNHDILSTVDQNTLYIYEEPTSSFFGFEEKTLDVNTTNIGSNLDLDNLYLFVYPRQPNDNTMMEMLVDFINVSFPEPEFSYTPNICGNTYTFNDGTDHRFVIDGNPHNQKWQIENSSHTLIYSDTRSWPNTPDAFSYIFPVSGTYYVTLTYDYLRDDGSVISTCSSIQQTIIISIADILSVTATPNPTPPICPGDPISFTVNVNGGTPPYTYHWYPSASSQSGNVFNFSSVNCNASLYYNVTVTDANNCTSSLNPPQYVPCHSLQHIESINTGDESCPDQCDGWASVYISPNQPGITNTFEFSNGFSIANNSVTAQVVGLCPGDYTVTITNNFGCSSVGNFTIEPAYSDITIIEIIEQDACYDQNNGSISINATGTHIPPSPYCEQLHYIWSNGYIGLANTQNNLNAGTYYITINNNCGCYKVVQAVVGEHPYPDYTYSVIHSDPCCNGSIDITTGSTLSYQWSGPNNFTSPYEDISDLCSGRYYLTVTDIFSCQYSGYWDINLINMQTFVNQSCLDMALTSGTTITSGLDICGDVSIYNQPVTIQNCTIRFAPTSQILMTSWSSNLILENAVLTSYCPDIMWDGIKFTNNQPSVTPTITMTNSEISNAITGIDASNYVVLDIQGSFFINNIVDLSIKNTQYNHTIKNNEFKTTIAPLYSNLYSNNPIYRRPFRHIDSYNNNKLLTLISNKFKNILLSGNNDFTTPLDSRGTGIYNEATNLIVSGNYVTPSEFSGLKYGVVSASPAAIVYTKFYYNNRGARLTKFSHVEYCDFIVTNNGNNYISPQIPNLNTLPCGLILDNSHSFHVQNNFFREGFIGLATINTINEGLKIYRNTFQNLYVGTLGNGINEVLLNCNSYYNNSNPAFMPPALPVWGGDMMVYNGKINLNQRHFFFPSPTTTFNRVINNRCTSTFNKLKFHNYSLNNYDYLFNKYDDVTDIRDCDEHYATGGNVTSDEDGNGYDYGTNFNVFCKNISYTTKSVGRVIIEADSLMNVTDYKINVLTTLVDNGQTEYFLNYIENLKPNNFNVLYNQLISASPYLSDEVLIAFMTSSINKPAHKKVVVLANSPLPYNVRQYIDQMNINQNFKNQIWDAQAGFLNARVRLEQEIDWLKNRRQDEINMAALSTIEDSTGQRTDSLISYLENSIILNDRLIRYDLLVIKKDYVNASDELATINTFTTELTQDKQIQYEEFEEIESIYLESVQLTDSVAKSLIIQNQPFIESIAAEDFHVAQVSAKALLERIGFEQEYPVWIPDGSTVRNQRIEIPSAEIYNNNCEEISIFPNPSDGIINISTNNINEGNLFVEIFSSDGKFIERKVLISNTTQTQIKCTNYIAGKYWLIFYNNKEPICSKELIIQK